jgi:hypothetical protein
MLVVGAVSVTSLKLYKELIPNRQLSAPYLLSGRKDSFDLNLPALGAPFACGVVK